MNSICLLIWFGAACRVVALKPQTMSGGEVGLLGGAASSSEGICDDQVEVGGAASSSEGICDDQVEVGGPDSSSEGICDDEDEGVGHSPSSDGVYDDQAAPAAKKRRRADASSAPVPLRVVAIMASPDSDAPWRPACMKESGRY